MAMRNARNLTAQEHRDLANASRKRSAESWERSDTDGFVSQWASDLTAREHEAWANLLDDDCMIVTEALFMLDGTIASTHSAYGDYGRYWVLNDLAAERYGKRFFSPSKAQNPEREWNNNRTKGFTLGLIRVEGYVDIAANGTGLSGATTAHIVVRPVVDRLRSGDYAVLTTDSYSNPID
jgi:hypothetical protein